MTEKAKIDDGSIDREDAEETAKVIRESPCYPEEACRHLCELAGMESEWDEADGETFERVLSDAADVLGVDLL